MDANQLHMVELWLDGRKLVDLGRMLRLPIHHTDNNYIVHCALGELFQEQAPSPFAVMDMQRPLSSYENGISGQAPVRSEDGRLVRVLGYSTIGNEVLREVAQGFASPAVFEMCRWDRLASKPMPETFPVGTRLGFEVRACPVLRKAKAGATSSGKRWGKGQEIDVFLSRVWDADDRSVKINREDVYREWLADRLTQQGGASTETISVDRFSIARMTRRTGGKQRKARTIQRPDVTFSGTLRVNDSEEFSSLLRNGIGRHRSFGFGMLKIRRA